MKHKPRVVLFRKIEISTEPVKFHKVSVFEIDIVFKK